MFASFTAELFKLRKRSALWVIATLWMVLTLIFGYVFPYVTYSGTPVGPSFGDQASSEGALAEVLPESLVPSAIGGFPMFAGALALLIGVLCGGDEYGWQTTKVIYTQGPRRISVLAGKMSALLVVILCIVLLTFIVDGTAAWLISGWESAPAVWPSAGELAVGVLGGWLIVSMWATCGMFLGTLVRSTALAVGLGLVWALAVENLIRVFANVIEPIDFLQQYFPGTNAGSLASALGVAQGQAGGTPGVSAVVGGAQATLVLIAYVAAFGAISAITVQRRDIT